MEKVYGEERELGEGGMFVRGWKMRYKRLEYLGYIFWVPYLEWFTSDNLHEFQ